jgi:hypothetical protein
LVAAGHGDAIVHAVESLQIADQMLCHLLEMVPRNMPFQAEHVSVRHAGNVAELGVSGCSQSTAGLLNCVSRAGIDDFSVD